MPATAAQGLANPLLSNCQSPSEVIHDQGSLWRSGGFLDWAQTLARLCHRPSGNAIDEDTKRTNEGTRGEIN
jgi:hypothetical protein